MIMSVNSAYDRDCVFVCLVHVKAVDLGEELIRLGHAVSCQDSGSGGGDGENLGSLQRMLVNTSPSGMLFKTL